MKEPVRDILCPEVRRRWMEEDLRKPLHPERHMAHTSWLDVANEPVSPSSSPHIHRSSSWRDMAAWLDGL